MATGGARALEIQRNVVDRYVGARPVSGGGCVRLLNAALLSAGPCRRLTKELKSYEKELAKQQERVDAMKARGEEEHEVRQQVRLEHAGFGAQGCGRGLEVWGAGGSVTGLGRW